MNDLLQAQREAVLRFPGILVGRGDLKKFFYRGLKNANELTMGPESVHNAHDVMNDSQLRRVYCTQLFVTSSTSKFLLVLHSDKGRIRP